MDEQTSIQVEQAIQAAFDPRTSQDIRAQALDFVNRVRTDPQGWRVCLFLALREPRAQEVIRHVCLDTVNHAMQSHQLSEEDFGIVRDTILTYIRRFYGTGRIENDISDPTPILNKLTQTMTVLFAFQYRSFWPSFFHDMQTLTSLANDSNRDNAAGVDFYLRVLVSVHEDIGDTLITRSQEEQKRANELKDLVRERDVQSIANFWHEVLSQWRSKSDSIIELCLTCLGRWVTWIDISLVVNDALLDLLFDHLRPQPDSDVNSALQSRRIKALETFNELLSKKMGASDKLELIDFLKIDRAVSAAVQSRSLTELRSTSDYDTDFAEEVGKLVNNTVCDIVKILEGTQDTDNLSIRGQNQLQTFLPFIIRFLSDEYDEICASVIPCLTDLLTLMRKKLKSDGAFVANNTPMLSLILDAVIGKMRFDETTIWGNESTQTDEAEFEDLRRRLHVLQQAVAAVDESMYIAKITNIIVTTFDNYQNQNTQMDWRDIDLALHEMFLFGELGLKNGGLYSKTKPASPASERLIEMMFKLVQSDVASFPHAAIQLQYMEICVRYSMFFDANPGLIPPVLEKSVLFVHHNHVKVKMRSWYLLQRFVKHVRNHIGQVAQSLISSLGPLLPIKAELPDEDVENEDGDVSSNENSESADARFNSQLYLYEAVGCICAARGISVDEQATFLRSVNAPLFLDLQNSLKSAESGEKRSILQVHHLIMALGTLARGYSDWSPGSTSSISAPQPPSPVSEEFQQTAEAILTALERLSSFFDVREAARFSFARLIGVLGNRVLPQLPRWIQGLLTQTSTKDEMAMFIRLLDQVVFSFKTEIFQILNSLLTPFLQTVFTGIADPPTGTDDEIQLAEIKREYLGFLLVILNNNLEGVLVSEVNQPIFATVISTIEHLARDASDLPTARLSLSVLVRMVSTWGGPDVVNDPANLTNGATTEKLDGFDQFMMTHFSPLCWALPSNSAFDAKDGQARQVLNEAAILQKAIYAKTGNEYLTYLRDVELSGMGMNNDNIDDYLRALSTSDMKSFQGYFKNLVSRTAAR